MAAERAGVRLALAGDTMLGRGVAMRLRETRSVPVDAAVIAAAAEADVFVLNLECCVSERGRRWPDRRKPFFFRAPPVAAELLGEMGVDCVTLANNHALDYGPEALLDTFEHLSAAGVAWVGAGPDVGSARAAWQAEALGLRLVVIAASDHPETDARPLEHGRRAGRRRIGARADRCDPGRLEQSERVE